MPARFTVLASGSSGNASLLEAGGFGLLIDCGLGPRVLGWRLAAVGLSWKAVSAVVLTHTHGDHWNPLTLAHLRSLNVPLYAHPRHHDYLSRYDEHEPLRKAGLARPFAAGELLAFGTALTGRPVRVPHDSEPTFAFRIDAPGGSLGFASDVGHVTPDLMDAFAGVDTLAVEFNHDVRMQRASGRSPQLIDRVLGPDGHLSNAQAAELAAGLARTDGLRHLIQLHLSRDCNTPDLAATAGRAVVAPDTRVVTASQLVPTPPLLLDGPVLRAVRRASVQPALPGLWSGHPVTGP